MSYSRLHPLNSLRALKGKIYKVTKGACDTCEARKQRSMCPFLFICYLNRGYHYIAVKAVSRSKHE